MFGVYAGDHVLVVAGTCKLMSQEIKPAKSERDIVNRDKRRVIWNFAEKVRGALKLDTPLEVDKIRSAIMRMGGELDERPSTRLEASIRRTNGAGFVIVLDSTKPPKRKLFSLAHELGHLFVHMGFGNPARWGQEQDYVESYARSGYDEEELEANEFAAALLMPTQEFLSTAQRATLHDVAEHFGVSTDAALIRGRWLEIYPWT